MNHPKTILITGASGFIGKALVKSLCQQGFTVRATVRSASAVAQLSAYEKQLTLKNLSIYNLGELTDQTDWHDALAGVDTIIHCAARAHVLHETSVDPLETFRQINTRVTTHLAKQACDLGVCRFIFLSSIGVLGRSSGAIPYTDASPPNPQVPYAQAKLEAEEALNALPNTMERVIIRAPLVYGPGVKGNFGMLVKFLHHHIPLPFGAVKNRRQFIGIKNLVDFMTTCINHETAIHDTFLISDPETISTTQLLRTLADSMGKRALLLPLPQQHLHWGLTTIGQARLAEQLLGNLEIQSDKARDLLGWVAPYTMREQLYTLGDQ